MKTISGSENYQLKKTPARARRSNWLRALVFILLAGASSVGARTVWHAWQKDSEPVTLESIFIFALSAYIAALFVFSVFTDRAKKE